MKKSNFLLILFVLLGCAGCMEFSTQVIFRVQTEAEAFDYVMELIKASPYYKKHGYKVVLPKHEVFKKLYENPDDVVGIDEDALKQLFVSELYDRSVFEKPLMVARKTVGTLNKALQKLALLKKNWGLALQPRYEVIFTPYGAEATHQWSPDVGRISILASPATLSKEGLETTIIHKIVNIGIEEIIKRYNLGQWQKERIIDLIIMLYLNDVVPYYRPPDLNKKYGDRRIDQFVDKEAIMQDLPSAIERFKAQI